MTNMICNKALSWIIETTSLGQTIGKNDSQLIYGEKFITEKEEGEYVFGRSALDSYKGYVAKTDLSPEKEENVREFVSVPLTHLYPSPTFKVKPVMEIPFLASVCLSNKEQDNFVETKEGYWVFKDHLQKEHSSQTSYIETTRQFLNAPYLYGGQSVLGIDCSGLVRVSLLSAGIHCPRDCNRQVNELPYDISNNSRLKRGDIVYVPTHVVIMLDSENCINATARHMKTVIEPFSDIMKAYKEIISIKRFI